jgi:hypothetical protein
MRTTCQLLDSVQLRRSREAFANSEPNREAPELCDAARTTIAVKPLRPLNSTASSLSQAIQRNAVIAVKLLRRLRRIAKSQNFPVHSGSRIPLSNHQIGKKSGKPLCQIQVDQPHDRGSRCSCLDHFGSSGKIHQSGKEPSLPLLAATAINEQRGTDRRTADLRLHSERRQRQSTRGSRPEA